MFPLSVRAAHVRRKGKTLVGPVDLHLEALTGTTIVIGPNGSGKTSLLRMLHGILRVSAGSVVWACSDSAAQKRQAFVFQTPILLRRSVLDNIAYPMRLEGLSRREAREAAAPWAERVGIGDAITRSATSLSGGERQKMALARALISKPDVLFLDEPCAALDGRSTREIETILTEAANSGTRLIMSTHDMGQARRLASDVIFMHGGEVREHTPADDFFAKPASKQATAFLNGDIVE